jgi:uncharacterized protein
MSRPPVLHGQVVLTPLSQFVLKVHSRCDLACDHCYVYEAADQSWRGRPMAISDEVISRTAQRIAEHAASHALDTVQVVLHGGEPLLAGRARLLRVVTELHAALRGVCRLDLRIHTNGVLLNEDFCELFAEHGVKVGISVDGDRTANDRHRRYADGRSSYDQVIRSVRLLHNRFRELYAGLLCTIDVANDPLTVYQSLIELHPPRIDFLLPHATWDHPPTRTSAAGSEYADWLIAIFERWLSDGRPVQIRTFDSILSTLRGGKSFTEALGLGPAGLIVIETDGTYEQVDSLKAAFDGAPETGMNVFDHTLDIVSQHPGVRAREQGIAGLCQTCQECPVVTSCGGGLYPHRYRTGSGFANPSAYCADLLKLISHISSRLPAEPAAAPGIPAHALSGRDLRALAAGFGDGAAMAQLTGSQHSLVRGLLGAVYQESISAPAVSAAVKADLRSAWSLLTALDRDRPAALTAVLGHPYLRVWAMRCLTDLRSTVAGPGNCDQPAQAPGLAADLGHFGAIAAAAAIHAGTSAAVRVPVMAGAVHLPTLGRLEIGPHETASPQDTARPLAQAPGLATVEVAGDAVRIRLGGSRWTLSGAGLLSGAACRAAAADSGGPASWQPVRRLGAPGIRIALEDTDPYRDCHHWPAAPRLTDAEFGRWQRQFLDAWQEIERAPGAYAPALAAGLTTLMPLAAARDGGDLSATAKDVFGTVALALPADPVALALLLIHEFQHVKLSAVLDLYDLYDQADDRLFHAPWREGKQQLGDLFQGTYAHLAVTDFWHVRQHSGADPAATRRFEQCRAQACEAVETLAASGSLTPLGTWFVDEMRHSAGR